MNETNNNWLTSTGITINEGIGTSTNLNTGTYISGNSTLNTFSSLTIQDMTPKQVKVAVFEITRDEDTNKISSTKFLKELWVERKNGTSIDLIVAKQLDKDFNPENIVIKEILTVSF